MRPGISPESVLAQLERLPTLPAVVLQLLQLTSNDEAGARDLVSLLRADQSLAAKVLSVASSTGGGIGRAVRTLEQAVPLLGFNGVRSIVLAAGVIEYFRPSRDTQSGAFDRAGFWLHSIATACAARQIAAALPDRRVAPDQAYLAGLLHDLGKAALDTLFPKAYERIARRAVQERGDIADVERHILGIDHTRAGRRLAEHWKLPTELRDAIWLHHLAGPMLPSSVANPPLVAIVHLADTLTREQRVGFSGNFQFYEHSPELAAAIGLSAARLDEIATTTIREAREQASQFDLDREPPEGLYVRAMGQANAELGRINTELATTNQKLATAARFFRAVCDFDRQIGAAAELPEVVAALTDAAVSAFGRRPVAAFGLRSQGSGLDLAWRARDGEDGQASIEPLPPDFQGWLELPPEEIGGLVVRTPAVLRQVIAPTGAVRENGAAWLTPIFQQGRLVGGLLLPSERDGVTRVVEESGDLRSFLHSLGLALSRTAAQRAARQLTDDLAETNRQLQAMQVELLRTRSLSMIAEMASGAGHELNSPLTVISGRAQMLAQQIQDPEQRRLLDVIQDKAHECSRIVSELMEFARPRPPQFALIELYRVLSDVCDEFVLSRNLGPNSVMLTAPGFEPYRPAGRNEPLIQLTADPAQIRALLLELLSNAADAVESQGRIIAGAAVAAVRCSPAIAGDGVEVVVADDGAGMPTNVQERAFDPFFSHRPAGRRRGLGLARASRIVESHSGRIWLESTVGQGTQVHVILPRTQPSASA